MVNEGSGIKIGFHSGEVPDEALKFAVIMASYQNKWIFCRHKERDTYEIPGGHREAGEGITAAAKRELIEETGAAAFDLSPVSVYSVTCDGGEPSYGMLFYAKITELGELNEDVEIGEVILSEIMPDKLTYPRIQPFLFDYCVKRPNTMVQIRKLRKG